MKKILLPLLIGVLITGCGKQVSEDDSLSKSQNVLEESATESKTDSVEQQEVREEQNIVEDESELDKIAIDGYISYIKNSHLYNEIKSEEYVYQIAFINEDNIPDILLSPTDVTHGGFITVLYYPTFGSIDDEIIEVSNLGSYNMISYFPYKNVLLTNESGSMGVSGAYYNTLTNSGIERLAYNEDYYDEDYENPSESHYYLETDNEVSKDEYEAYLSKLLGNSTEVIFNSYENEEAYPILNEEALKNHLFLDEFIH